MCTCTYKRQYEHIKYLWKIDMPYTCLAFTCSVCRCIVRGSLRAIGQRRHRWRAVSMETGSFQLFHCLLINARCRSEITVNLLIFRLRDCIVCMISLLISFKILQINTQCGRVRYTHAYALHVSASIRSYIAAHLRFVVFC